MSQQRPDIVALYAEHAERLRAQCLVWGVPAGKACDLIVQDLMLALGAVLDERPDLDVTAWIDRDLRRRAAGVLWGLGLPIPEALSHPRSPWWDRWIHRWVGR